MLTKWFRKFRRSIFAKLLLILALTWGAINLLAGGFYNVIFIGESDKRSIVHLDQYVDYLIADIGSPIDTTRVRNLAHELAIDIGLVGPQISWSTADVNPKKYYRGFRPNKNKRFGRQRGQFYVARERDGIRYIFHGNMMQYANIREWLIPLFIGLLALILFISWMSMRRVLRPIRLLRKGAEKIGQGDLNHQIRVCSKDELGELSTAFNRMTTQIRQMIQSRDQLLLDVSHELRSPITRMKLALALLEENPKTASISDDLVEMETMIAEILENERLDSVHGGLTLSTTDVGNLLADVVDDFQDRQPGIAFSKPAQPIFASIDEGRIAIVAKNLLENALKYSPRDTNPVELSLTPDVDRLEIRIRDYGEGIAAEDLPHIFEPFYRVDKSRSRETGGYGLGLSLCKKIVEAHAGQLDIESEHGKGTTVRVLLPAKRT